MKRRAVSYLLSLKGSEGDSCARQRGYNLRSTGEGEVKDHRQDIGGGKG